MSYEIQWSQNAPQPGLLQAQLDSDIQKADHCEDEDGSDENGACIIGELQ